ncbi:MAG: formate dehydrogenase-N subunit alpha [Chloroflexi bacterium]|nr:MAG: formate dehydrogenase-N subunit alpha [Chloroflexota bacterium]TME69169.1 MAG: formate dehydrogenase-N subunit alpha [Chloroflexota bacterium]TMG51766.1 MAG: formate dehydrogenase-N subunit alpha [Chloroflexota bacterium]
MTNHWRDIKHADLILINGANPAEAHPVGFQWFVKAKLDPTKGPGAGGGAKIIHADPRYTRTSAMADMYLRIRTGTDVAYFGGLINYVIQNKLYHEEYVKNYTNASFIVKQGFDFNDGLFTGYNSSTRAYDTSTWTYETEGEPIAGAPAGTTQAAAKRDKTLQDPRTVWQLMAKHYSRYTPEMVSSITGIPVDQFNAVAKMVGEMGKPDKVMTIVYAVGLTHHTTGGQLIRSGALLQLILGNMGRPGGGMNAERGHANIQGNTDHAISWEILPGYLRIPAPGQKNLDDYVRLSAPKKSDPNSWNFFGTNYRNFMVSLLKGWYGAKATKDNEYAFDFIPKPAVNSSWMSIYDQALKGKMEGVILSGMTATSIGPDSNQVMTALGKLKWLVVMDPLPTTSSEFWKAPNVDPASIQTEVFMLPTTHWIEKDGSFVNSGRWSQWKDQVIPPEGEARHDHWVLADLFDRVKTLYKNQSGKFPDPLMALTLDYKDPKKPELEEIAKEINGKNLTTGGQMASFALLKDDGTTTAGDWIYTGSYPDAGNLAKRRNGISNPTQNDPTGMGFYPNWAWSWPLNRRVMYNRASADIHGKPWDPKRPGIQWNGTTWVGDVPDYPPTMSPEDPAAWLPFIMNGEGVGRLFSNSMIDGPFPEHYEPVEAPIANPLHPQQSEDPVAFLYDQAAGRPNRFGKAADFPYVATSYRLTEHEHYVTQHVPLLVGLQPQAFVEVPAELADQKSIKSGDRVRVSSARGKLEVVALVTKRLGPITLAGNKTVYQIGIPIHWGFVGVSAEQNPDRSKYWLANALTPFVGDANARTPEFKAFLVNIEKL